MGSTRGSAARAARRPAKQSKTPPLARDRRLKNALCESARISVGCDEWSTWYDQKKRTEGKKHLQATLALARRRTDILHAMLINGSPYEPKAMTH